MKMLIKNGRIIDPANNLDNCLDILIENSKISKVGKDIKSNIQETIDAKGKVVIPGLVDMHVHLREPGREDKETISSATQAALKGGVTSVLAMPNTQPAMDSAENIKLLNSIINKSAHNNVFVAGAITKGRQGKELTDIAGLVKFGVVAISDDGSSVDSDEIMLEAFKKARENNIVVICHSEDKALSANGVVNLGLISTKLGLRGISRESEYKRVARDIELAHKIKCPVHIAHVSCKESVELIARAKKKGVKVTCETAPHYFAFSEEVLSSFDTNFKVNPPLRGKEDVTAIKEGLKTGIIDVIASDHAPHTESEKEIEFERAEFGAIGLETILSASITELVQTGLLTWSDLVSKLAVNPAKILGINKGTLSIGQDADIVVIDPDKEWILRKEDIVSKSKNSPFIGKKMKGVVEYTICGGKIVYRSTDDRRFPS